jgi:osmoprotectant transport system substrate-binding protein
MRKFRSAAVGAALVALIVSACGPGAGSPSPATTASPAPTAIHTATPGARTLASTLIFGGPPECPQRPFCLLGLAETYGLEFAEFRPLDSGGPITVEALANGEIQVGLLFSSDPSIVARDFIALEDDRGLQRADNLVPVINAQVIADQPAVGGQLNRVSAALSQDELIELNRQYTEDRLDPRDIAAAWLEEKGLLTVDAVAPGYRTIIVGRTNFYEQDILSELYAQALEAAGYTVGRQEASGAREVVFGALVSGQIDILPEYAATALEHVNGGAGEATADAEETTELLRGHLAEIGLTALDPAPAANQNAIVVTRATADEYQLTQISDLAQPAP